MSFSFWAPLRAGVLRCALVAPASLLTSTATAHVTLDSPNGGESFTGGDTTTIQWRPTPEHDTVGWGLWYSTASDNGPWEPIALDIPPGDISTDSIHLFDWTLPNLDDSDVWVRVLQDNVIEQDYYDVSDSSFSIVATLLGDANGDGFASAADYAAWRDGAGEPEGYAHWRRSFSGPAPTVVSTVVPEPSAVATCLGLTAGLLLAPQRRPVLPGRDRSR